LSSRDLFNLGLKSVRKTQILCLSRGHALIISRSPTGVHRYRLSIIAKNPAPCPDSLVPSSAHGLTLVTRNVKDFAGLGVVLQ
jgi:hypothetical protein